MKKKNIIFISIIVLLIVIIIVLLNIPDKLYYKDSLIMSLPDYKDNDCYFYGENKDYTDYCKFYFKKNIEESIKENKKFVKVDSDNISLVKEYFDNYNEVVKNADFFDKYDFDISQIEENDYVYILDKSNENESLEKFDFYNLYYYDASKNIVYYIHNNI